MRNLHLEHHDRDDDREDAVAERFESVLDHISPRFGLKEPPAYQHGRRDRHHEQQEQDG
jgi:hypothetical protein